VPELIEYREEEELIELNRRPIIDHKQPWFRWTERSGLHELEDVSEIQHGPPKYREWLGFEVKPTQINDLLTQNPVYNRGLWGWESDISDELEVELDPAIDSKLDKHKRFVPAYRYASTFPWTGPWDESKWTEENPAVYKVEPFAIPHPIWKDSQLLYGEMQDWVRVYVNPNNNQAWIKVSSSSRDVKDAGIYKQVYDDKKGGCWIQIPRDIHEHLSDNGWLPDCGGRREFQDIDRITALLYDGNPRSYAQIDRDLGWPNCTAKRLVEKNSDLFEVFGGGRQGKKTQVKLKSLSIKCD